MCDSIWTERKGGQGPNGELGWAGVSVPPSSPSPPQPGVASLTGMVWLPCSALMAACASAWEEYFTKAHPGWTGEAEPGPEGPEGGQRSQGLRRGAREGPRGPGASQKKVERVRHKDREKETPRNTETEKDLDGPEI